MGLLLFNWMGYKLVIHYFQQQADRQLEARIDVNDYDESQLMEMRVPLNMPYQNNATTDFERYYGEIKIDGKYYTYVKRKIENGYLILKCIPNQQKEMLKNTDSILFNANNGLDQDHNQKDSSPLAKVIKTLLSDYVANSIFSLNNESRNVSNNWLISKTAMLNSHFISVEEQPPDHSSVII